MGAYSDQVHPCLDVSRQEKMKYLVQLKKDVGKIAYLKHLEKVSPISQAYTGKFKNIFHFF